MSSMEILSLACKCSILGPTQSRISPSILQYTKLAFAGWGAVLQGATADRRRAWTDPEAQAALASSASLTSRLVRWARLRVRHREKSVYLSDGRTHQEIEHVVVRDTIAGRGTHLQDR